MRHQRGSDGHVLASKKCITEQPKADQSLMRRQPQQSRAEKRRGGRGEIERNVGGPSEPPPPSRSTRTARPGRERRAHDDAQVEMSVTLGILAILFRKL